MAERLDISNTAYGRELALKERELEAAAIKMIERERERTIVEYLLTDNCDNVDPLVTGQMG